MSELATGAQSVLVCSIACTVVVVVVTAVRLYTRIILVAGLGSDDYALLAAITTFFAMMSLFLVGLKYGLGKHLADVNPRKQDMFMKLMIGAGTLYNTVMLACKLSILLLYRRLFPLQSFNKRWWCVAVFTISYSLVIAVASAAGRTPVAAKWYINQTGDKCPPNGPSTLRIPPSTSPVCGRQHRIWNYMVANLFLPLGDILILILPIPVIKSLSLELRQKITLYILFALGSA
ncbi:hypothetical protein B0J12DRAFT_81100 [Macrophomina phaseolina]|uniref:Rhodopsin domain-containing protein n=1 Tax=Macrophomina phaseolina TaxID=35725 RepID=A0ABQ8GC04_9PEZI|nr:hypothetical protein B0J12DRAFT_81100 [Macrophomina phaseolina]